MNAAAPPREPTSADGAPPEGELAWLAPTDADGWPQALAELFTTAYPELHRLARSQRARWRGDDPLCAMSLVHEAYLRLSQRPMRWQSRAHFLNAASRTMRHILVDHRRREKAAKRGGEQFRVPVDSVPLAAEDAVEDVLALHQAMKLLGELDQRQARVVECRFFAGLGIDETATTLGVSSRTVKRDWSSAQAWLHRELTRTRSSALGHPTTTCS